MCTHMSLATGWRVATELRRGVASLPRRTGALPGRVVPALLTLGGRRPAPGWCGWALMSFCDRPENIGNDISVLAKPDTRRYFSNVRHDEG